MSSEAHASRRDACMLDGAFVCFVSFLGHLQVPDEGDTPVGTKPAAKREANKAGNAAQVEPKQAEPAAEAGQEGQAAVVQEAAAAAVVEKAAAAVQAVGDTAADAEVGARA